MTDTYKKYPFWRTGYEDAEKLMASAKRGERHTLCTSAGGHEIHYLTYGEKIDYKRTANFSSACGAKDPKYYADREGKPQTIFLFGATHGQETEGVCGLLNLISLLETGRDLGGLEVPSLTEAFNNSGARLIILPIYNVDGRIRCVPDSMIEEPPDSLRYHGQGTWKDGTLCGWPQCKTVHPIKNAVDFLGAYYNDDGVNLMHDNFFAPMAQETRALLALADEEQPNLCIGLHGGSNSTSELLQPSYVPDYLREGVHMLAVRHANLAAAHGLKTHVRPVPTKIESFPPPSFNLTSALSHVCGAVSATFESNEGLADNNAFTALQILQHHYCLFEACFG